MAGDAGGNAAAAGVGVLGLAGGVGEGEELLQHEFEFPALEPYRGGLDGEGARAEGFDLEAVAFELFSEFGEDDHLGRQEIDEERHEEALTLG